MGITVQGLDRYALTLRDLRSMRGRLAEVMLHIDPPSMEPLVSLAPRERLERIGQHLQRKLEEVRALWPEARYEVRGDPERPYTIDVTLSADLLPRARRLSGVHVSVKRIRGLRKRRKKRELF